MKKISRWDSVEDRIRLQTSICGDNECWNWIGHKDKDGYGILRVNTTYKRATRVLWKITFGEIPDGMFVCHHCDNPSCMNLKHLFLGTCQDNHTDMDRKERRKARYGDQNPNTKLTNQDLTDIINLWNANNYSQREIGKMFNVSQRTISRITRGEERIQK